MLSPPSRVPYFRERSFGLSVGGMLVLIAALLLWRGRGRYAEVAAALGAVLIVLGRMKPSLLTWPSAAWWRLAVILAYVNSRIILTLAFALLLTPIGLIWRTIGRDPLALRRDGSPGWTPYPARYRAPDHYTRMY
jgi:saxitoxin biosynthesis operon SxtJ-like protein